MIICIKKLKIFCGEIYGNMTGEYQINLEKKDPFPRDYGELNIIKIKYL